MNEAEELYSRQRDKILESRGESVTVTFPDNSTRNITAIIRRRNIDSSDDRAPMPRMKAMIANDSTLGIASSEMDGRGSIKMSVAYRMGQAAQNFGVYFRPEHEGISHDGCFLYCELR